MATINYIVQGIRPRDLTPSSSLKQVSNRYNSAAINSSLYSVELDIRNGIKTPD